MANQFLAASYNHIAQSAVCPKDVWRNGISYALSNHVEAILNVVRSLNFSPKFPRDDRPPKQREDQCSLV